MKTVTRHLISTALGAVLAAALTASAQAAGAAPDMGRVDAAFAALPKDGPGCALGIYSHGELVALKGYGYASVEHRVPISPDTVFDIGSVSKQFTAMSAIILAEQGKLSLDDDIRKTLPEMPDYGTPITIRQLINHTSGIRNYFDVLFIRGLSQRDPVSRDEIYSVITGLKALEFPPGTQEKYSNSGYFLLGRIVERVSGQSLGRFEQENIFGPLGMTRTHVHEDLGEVVPDRASGYLRDPRGGFRMAVSQFEGTGDGAVYTTVRDLALWDADFYRGKVWRPAVKAEMLRVGKFENGQPVTAEPGVYYVGGLNLGKRRGLTYMGHPGKELGFMADLTRYPDQQISIALLCNHMFRITAVADALADLMLADKYVEPEPKPEEPGKPAAAAKGEPIPAAILSQAPGVYYNDEIDGRYVIAAEGGGLVLRMGPHRQRLGPLESFGDEVLGAGRTRLQLRRDGAGRIVGLTFEGFEFRKL